MAWSGCHRGDVIEQLPTPMGLRAYRALGVVLHRVDPRANDEVMDALQDALHAKLERASLFPVTNAGTRGELVMHVSVVSLGEDGRQITLGVNLVDTRRNASIGRFEVVARPDMEPPAMGGRLNLDAESKTSKAIDAAVRELVAYLEDHG
jgi:hypothetical protein